MRKCFWCQDGGIMEHYHDTEWGIPCHSDRKLFEYLLMEAMSAGLSWKLMLQKREIFRSCFAGFDYRKIAQFTEDDIETIIAYPGMIRSHRKAEAIVNNAKSFIRIIEEFGSFDTYLWKFTDGKTLIYQQHLDGEWITKNELSDTIAADLKKRGFKYLGSTLIYSFIQSIGMVNDHTIDCWMFDRIGGIIV